MIMKRKKILSCSDSRPLRVMRRARLLPTPTAGWDQFFSLLRNFEFTEQFSRNQPDWPLGPKG